MADASVICPFGDYGRLFGTDARLACEGQALFMIIFCVFLPVCCIGICAWKRAGSKCCGPLASGRSVCKDFGKENGRSSFTIVKKTSSKTMRRNSSLAQQEDVKPVVPAQQDAAEDLEQGAAEENDKVAPLPAMKSRLSVASEWSTLSVREKVHVVWDVNVAQALDWLSGKTAQVPSWNAKPQKRQSFFSPWRRADAADDGSVLDERAQEEVPPQTRSEQNTGGEAVSRELTVLSTQSQLQPAYASDERVEYFSATHGAWIMGQISVKIGAPSASEKQGTVAYSVTLHQSEQVRRHVELSSLRSVLQPGNPCELWSQDLKQWLPGKVQSLEARGGPLRYYKILLDDRSTVCRGEASKVRHSFPAGSKVLVYQDLERGWVPAEVSGSAEATVQNQDVSETKNLAEYMVMVSVRESPLDAIYEVPSSLVRWPSPEPEVQHISTDGTFTI